jgi:hypothetical protein
MTGTNSKIIPEYHQGLKHDDFLDLPGDAILKIYNTDGHVIKSYELTSNKNWKLIK